MITSIVTFFTTRFVTVFVTTIVVSSRRVAAKVTTSADNTPPEGRGGPFPNSVPAVRPDRRLRTRIQV